MDRRHEIVITDEADEDFDGIIHAIYQRSGTVSASKIVEAVNDTYNVIARYPESGQLFLPYRLTFKYQYRYKRVKQLYKIIYRIIENAQTVLVVAIRAGKMDDGPLIQRIEEE